MPLTHKGESILAALQKEYGSEKGKQVLFAGKNKGTFTGIDAIHAIHDGVMRLGARLDAILTARADDRRVIGGIGFRIADAAYSIKETPTGKFDVTKDGKIVATAPSKSAAEDYVKIERSKEK